MSRPAPIIFAVASIVMLVVGWLGAGQVENSLRSRAEAVLRAGGHDWAKLDLDGAEVVLRGAAPGEAARDAALAALGEVDWARVEDRVEIVAPVVAAPVETPRAALLIGAGAPTLAGSAPAGAAARIAGALRAQGGGAELVDLSRALGDAPEGWRAAEDGALALAAQLAQGRVTFAAGEVRLIGAPGDPPARERIAARVAALRAEGVEASAEFPRQSVAQPPEDANSDGAAAQGAQVDARIMLTVGDEGVRLGGLVPDAATRDALLAMAVSEFGAQAQDALFLAPTEARPGWRAAALSALSALAPLVEGRATVGSGEIKLTGRALGPHEARVSAEALAPARLEDWSIRHLVRVDLPARVAAMLLPPGRCAAQLSQAVRADPILFEPGEARIAEGSFAVLDAMAALLARCAGGRIEVGGHTDSQGSDRYNLELSEKRAAQVKLALEARGAPPGVLRSRGYGARNPAADNDTEAGRALNRRIAFIALYDQDGKEGAAP